MTVAEIVGTTQYLSFTLAEELYAVEIGKVREVLDYLKPTKVPRTPGYMLGVINLRGGAVPVIDMRKRLGMESTETTVNTCIIIVEVITGTDTVVLGAMADSVQEVFDLDATQIEPSPRIGTQIRTEYLKGMGKHNERFVLLLNIDRVFSDEEMADLVGSVESAPENNKAGA